MHPVLEEPVAKLSFIMTASCGFTRNEVVLPSFKYVLWGRIVHSVWFCLVWLFMSQSTAMVMSGRSVNLTTPYFLSKLGLAVNHELLKIFQPSVIRTCDAVEH